MWLNRLKKVIVRNLIFLAIFISYYLVYSYAHIGIPCLFKIITGYNCPGCGITRCLFSLVKLNIKEAFYYNELVTISFIPFIIILVSSLIKGFKHRKKYYVEFPLLFFFSCSMIGANVIDMPYIIM